MCHQAALDLVDFALTLLQVLPAPAPPLRLLTWLRGILCRSLPELQGSTEAHTWPLFALSKYQVGWITALIVHTGSVQQSAAMPGKDDDSRSWYIWVGAAGAALGAWWLLSSKRDYCGEPIKETDFDNFLVKQTGQKTGLTSGGKAKKRQAARGSFYNVSASDRGKVSGPFETFLKREEDDEEEEDDDPRNPLDFNSFLKTALPASKGGKANGQVVVQPEAQKPKPAAGPLPHQARVLVMFGTEYGFSKEIAEKLCDQLREAGAYW
jgi:hypothetical protein